MNQSGQYINSLKNTKIKRCKDSMGLYWTIQKNLLSKKIFRNNS